MDSLHSVSPRKILSFTTLKRDNSEDCLFPKLILPQVNLVNLDMFFYGFGQDVKTNDYKVMKMTQFNRNDDEDDEGYFFDYEVKVYSLKNDSWRKITKFPGYLRFMFQFFYHLLHRRGYGVLAGGVFHWVMPPRIELGMRNRIVGFDLGTEEFAEVLQPECADRNYMLDVGVLGGCLCAICNYDQVSVDVWVMKVYGVKVSIDSL